MTNMVNTKCIFPSIDCVGCMICKDICPKNAISEKISKKGFSYPFVDKTICINCGKCVKSCLTEKKVVYDIRSPLYFASKAKSEKLRMVASSGGIFPLLAKQVLDMHGVVYGVKLDNSLKVKHSRAESWDECKEFFKSKYVQSDMSGIFKLILNDLKKGLIVLFSGCPCQCYSVKTALKNYFYEGSILFVDFFCHGAPSPMVYADFVKHMTKKYKKEIKYVCFRDKEKMTPLPSCRGLRIYFDSFDVIDKNENNKLINLFFSNYISRPCCYNCKFTGEKRVSDVTLGDYWGCEKHYPDFFDEKGISIISINTLKGEKFFNLLLNDIDYIDVSRNNFSQPMLYHPPLKGSFYRLFWMFYKVIGYNNTSLLFLIFINIKKKCLTNSSSIKRLIKSLIIGFHKFK